MNFRFTLPASRDLDRILTYLGRHSKSGERRVGKRIRESIVLIREQPHAGQLTDRSGTRRIVVTPFPYVIFYRTSESEIVITAVRHAARRSKR